MATPVLTPPPSPGADQQPEAQPTTPSAPTAASPAPATPSPNVQQGTQLIIQAVSNVRALAKMFPAAAPHATEANNALRRMLAAMMQHQQPGEPAAPPA